MACFLVPGAEALVVSAINRRMGSRAKDLKLHWLSTMLWGGFILLAIEHIWHGEVVPWPPFLTAMSNPADVGPMLHEMALVGSAMAVVVTITWIVLVAITSMITSRSEAKATA